MQHHDCGVHITPLGEMPGPALAGFTTLDILVHGWDLAKASVRPRWASEVTRATPDRPRAARSRKKPSHPARPVARLGRAEPGRRRDRDGPFQPAGGGRGSDPGLVHISQWRPAVPVPASSAVSSPQSPERT